MKVIHFHRKPIAGYHSIENIFRHIRMAINGDIDFKVIEMPFHCGSHLGKLMNLFYVLFFKADVYHITGDIHYVAAFLPKEKTIITAHSVEGGRPPLFGWRKKLYRYLYFYRANQNCIYWTAVSHFTKKELSNMLGEEDKVKVIYNPISPVFSGASLPKNKSAYFEILLVGTHPRKQNELVFEALRNLENTAVTVVGDLGTSEKYWSEKIRLKTVLNASELEMKALYEKADVLVIASNNESFCMPIVEAQRMAVPVITSNATAMPEIAQNGALLIEPTVGNIRTAILQLKEDKMLQASLVKLGLENTRRFELSQIAKQYEDLYRSIA